VRPAGGPLVLVQNNTRFDQARQQAAVEATLATAVATLGEAEQQAGRARALVKQLASMPEPERSMATQEAVMCIHRASAMLAEVHPELQAARP
jgi:hypothetical protein